MWIKARIEQAGFIENQDYITVENLAVDLPEMAGKTADYFLRNKMGRQKETRGGHNRFDYIISLDMAIHLAQTTEAETVHYCNEAGELIEDVSGYIRVTRTPFLYCKET